MTERTSPAQSTSDTSADRPPGQQHVTPARGWPRHAAAGGRSPADRVRSVLGSRVGGGLVVAARPAATLLKGASHTTGTVHHARLVAHVDRSVTEPVLAQACGMSRQQHAYLAPADEGAEVTCRRCLAALPEVSDELVILVLMPAGTYAVARWRPGQAEWGNGHYTADFTRAATAWTTR
jgi:hypothetical protein